MSATVIADLAAELDIPENASASKVLYRDDHLRVIAFAFDAGQGLTEHSAPLPVVIQVVRGRLTLTLGEESTEAVPGTWIHLPPRLPHTVQAVEPTIMTLTMLPGGQA